MNHRVPSSTKVEISQDSNFIAAGVIVKSVGSSKTLSFWAGDYEFFIELSESQSANMARALTERCAVYQVSGRSQRFTINPNAL
ncbi:hypothetical protein [Malikia granosa]|uniref:hypothetical protein n=1 Tax=Malikia granosa TaxID=263067 RepID=UPI0011B02F64|nr:hypothetical protein [Malikia granosa]